MKTKMKLLAASIALLSTGAANAAIVTGAYAPGELYLTVFDAVGQQSYGLDLGIFQNDFVMNKGQTLSYDLSQDANYSTFLNNSGLVYQIVSTDQITVDYLSYGMLSTARGGLPTNITNDNTMANMMSKSSDWVLNLNADAGDQRDPSLNLSARAVPGSTGYYDSLSWGVTNGGMGFVAAQTVGQSVNFYKWNLDPADDFTVAAEELPNVWKLDTNGMLTYAAPVSAVPVPAAVWLFGSGLIGLVTVARRRRS